MGLKSGAPEIQDWDSNLLVLEGRVYTELDAFIEIARRFDGFWRLMPILYVIPRPLRDWLYLRIARNRYRWFGKRDTCYLPTPELAARFLD
jgi:predicted DCC family thiol-disulfide oxidoreductase YuxK